MLRHITDPSALSEFMSSASLFRQSAREAERQAEIAERNAVRLMAWQERYHQWLVEIERRECP